MGLRLIWVIALLPIAAFPMSAQSSAAPGEALKLHVHVYDLAKIPRATLHCGLGVTSHILARAGIEAVWEPGAPDAPEAHTADYPGPLAIGARPDLDDRKFLVVRFV